MTSLQIVKRGSASNAVRVRCPEDVFNLMRYLGKADRENFYVLHLNAKSQVLAKELIAVGTLSGTTLHPREIFKGAIINNSSCIICVHNHPSGDPTPSTIDKSATKRLAKAGMILGIPVMSHIIIGSNCYDHVRIPEQFKVQRQ